MTKTWKDLYEEFESDRVSAFGDIYDCLVISCRICGGDNKWSNIKDPRSGKRAVEHKVSEEECLKELRRERSRENE